VDPNEIYSVPPNVFPNSKKSQVAPEEDWENAFDEDEDDDY